MTPERDYLRRGRTAVLLLIAVLAAVSLIPPQRVGGVVLRRANILSDLLDFDDPAETETAEPDLFDEEEFAVDLEAVSERIVADTLPRKVQTRFEWLQPWDGDASFYKRAPDTTRLTAGQPVPIEDFDTTGMSRMESLYRALLEPRTVRIAVLGDSFIEGDILTADLRETLQDAYNGCGTGFAPMASPLTNFRRTVKTASKGWTAYNIMQYKNTPADLRDAFFVSGWVCRPAQGAQTRWEMTSERRHIDSCTRARILFISRNDSRVELTLNDTEHRSFDIEGAPAVREIAVEAERIRSLTFRVADGAAGFIGYGAIFEGNGVSVDNYSVRSNNGQAMFRTDPSVNAQIDAFGSYDLVILQYGLNIMQQGVRGYARYAEQIEKMIAYARQCFPSAAVLVLGVSERAVKGDDGFEPMDALPYMIEAQRGAARNAGAAFWDTAAAMAAQGGIARFVANGWAGKDYTHINYAGGRQVARSLFDAINAEVAERYLAAERERLQREEYAPVTSERLQRHIDRALLPEREVKLQSGLR